MNQLALNGQKDSTNHYIVNSNVFIIANGELIPSLFDMYDFNTFFIKILTYD